MAIKLNCDLGESFGSYTMGLDEAVMPVIDQANIACGFHGGDPVTMVKTLKLAKTHGVEVGAHPAYPDLVGFGRRSMNLSHDELVATILYQISAFDGMAQCEGLLMSYVKPHGALYNDMMASDKVRDAVMTAVSQYHRPVKLMLQATQQRNSHLSEANNHGIELLFEAFADRCYADDGKLLARSIDGAVHSRDKMLAQVQQIVTQGTLTSYSGHTLEIHADSLCVHGDNIEGVNAIEAIKELLTDA